MILTKIYTVHCTAVDGYTGPLVILAENTMVPAGTGLHRLYQQSICSNQPVMPAKFVRHQFEIRPLLT